MNKDRVNQVAELFGVPVESVRNLYSANARELQQMADKARRLGRNYRGKPASFWQAKADEFKSKGAR